MIQNFAEFKNNPQLEVRFQGLHEADHLKILDLSNTPTTSLEGLAQVAPWLQTLGIAHLNLGGTIPDVLWDFVNLHALYAQGNAFEGTLSSHIGNLFYLQELYLSDNILSGTLPTELGKLVNLQRLHLGHNHWTGPLPLELNQCTKLRRLCMANAANAQQSAAAKLTGNLLAFAEMRHLIKSELVNTNATKHPKRLMQPYMIM